MKDHKSEVYRLQFLGILILFFLTASLTFIDKLTFINSWDLGINQEYWGTNIQFISSVAFWVNMFLYSLLPAIIVSLTVHDKVITYSAFALPIYWGFIVYLSINSANPDGTVLPNLKYFVYGFLALAALVIIIKTIIIIVSLRVAEKVEDLVKFEQRALQKLSKLNPQHNQKLLEKIFGSHGKALNLLMAANYENDDDEKQRLMRMALNEVSIQEDHIKLLEKRMLQFTKIKE